jgi:Flp pilus assembly secretin CpaC
VQLKELRQAANQLEQSGFAEQAGQLRRIIADIDAQASERLAAKSQEVHRLQQEIRRLQELTGESRMITIRCQILEVDEDALVELGMVQPSAGADSNVAGSGVIPATLRIAPFQFNGNGIQFVAGNVALRGQILHCSQPTSQVDAAVERLQQTRRLAVLASPVVQTTDGRPATIHSGGEFPVLVPGENGAKTIQWRHFGVRMEATPTVLDDGRIEVAVAVECSERDFRNSVDVDGVRVPGITSREFNSSVALEPDRTMYLLGGISRRFDPTKGKAADEQAQVRKGMVIALTAGQTEDSQVEAKAKPRD